MTVAEKDKKRYNERSFGVGGRWSVQGTLSGHHTGPLGDGCRNVPLRDLYDALTAGFRGFYLP